MVDWFKERNRICDLILKEKMSYERIGQLYGVTGGAIRKVAKKLSIDLPRRRKINPSETFNKGTGNYVKCLYCGRKFYVWPSKKLYFVVFRVRVSMLVSGI